MKNIVHNICSAMGKKDDENEPRGVCLLGVATTGTTMPLATHHKPVDGCCDFGLGTLSCLRPRRNLRWNDLMRCCTFGLRVQPRLHFPVRGVAHGYGINYSFAKVDGASVTRLMVLQPQG